MKSSDFVRVEFEFEFEIKRELESESELELELESEISGKISSIEILASVSVAAIYPICVA